VRPFLVLVAVIAVGGAIAYGAIMLHPPREPSVARYCEYGSRSEPQFAGCLNHVTVQRIKSLNTHAAQFAKGEIASCLADAGPICHDDLVAEPGS
jgi:hypothetical protein